jgi:hypothetical protein
MTSMTPGAAFAASTSIDRIRAWATGLRTTLAWAIRGSRTSAAYTAEPESFAAPSVLGTERLTTVNSGFGSWARLARQRATESASG